MITRSFAIMALTVWFNENRDVHPSRCYWDEPRVKEPYSGISMEAVCKRLAPSNWEDLLSYAGIIPFAEVPAYYGR
jgi:hypothetical protein